jgi:hypothetical protein
MQLLLNNPAVSYPAQVQMFCDAGSVAHFLYGMVAGSDVVGSRGAVVMLSLFIGYQVSQLEAGASWSRTGGEFLEFAVGMLAAMALPYLGVN